MNLFSMIVASALLPAPQIGTVAANLSWIGVKLGRPIAVQAVLSKKLLFISDPDYPPDKLLALVATAVHGSVRATPNGLTLERSSKDLAALRDAEHRERVDWILARLQDVAAYRKKASAAGGGLPQVVTRELNGRQTAMQNFSSHGGPRPATLFPQQLLPSELLLEALIRRIGADELASIPPGRIVIYEDSPVDQAAPLPPDGDLIDQYLEASMPLDGISLTQDASAAIQRLRYAPFFSQVGKQTKRPERLRLRVTSARTNLLLQLEGFDGEEKRVLLADFVTQGRMKGRPYTNIASEDKAKGDALWSPISKATQVEIDRDLRSQISVGSPAPDWLVHPERTEPLNLFVCDCLGAFAAQTPEKCMVVDVDDFFWDFTRVCCSGERLCTTAFQDELGEMEDYERVEDATSIVLRPRTPEAVEATQADRKVLGRGIRDLIARNGDRLRTLSLLFHDASADRSPFAERLARDAMQIAPTSSDELLGDRTYRLLGAISENAWGDLMAGRLATAAQDGVTDEMRDLLVSDTRAAFGDQVVTDLKHHPIELYHEVPVGATQLSVKPREASVFRWQSPGKPMGPWQPVGRLMVLAPAAVRRLGNGHFILEGTQDSFEQGLARGMLFQMASETQRIITIHLPEGRQMEIVGSAEPHDATPLGPYRDLPQTVRDKVYQDAKDFQEEQLTRAFANLRSDEQPPKGQAIPP